MSKKFNWSELFAAISFILLGWLMLSWLDIICHNNADMVYHSWNFFVVFFK